MRAVVLNRASVEHLSQETNQVHRYTHVTLDETVTRIPAYLFMSQPQLVSVIGRSVKSVYSRAFAECENLVHVELNEMVDIVHTHAFSDCKSLKTIKFDVSTVIHERAFANSGLTKIKLSTSFIRENVFRRCKSLTEVVFAGPTKSINSTAFFGCVSLRHVHLPSCLQKLGNYAFLGSSVSTLDLSKCTELDLAGSALGSHCVRATLLHPDVYAGCTIHPYIANNPWGYISFEIFSNTPTDRLKFLRMDGWSRKSYHTHSTLKQTIKTVMTIACKTNADLPILPNFIWLQILNIAFN